MDLAMVAPAERHSEFIAHLSAKRPVLGKAQMMWIGGRPSANQTWLFGDEPYMLAIANAARFRVAQFAFVDARGGSASGQFTRFDFTLFAYLASTFEFRELLSEGIFDPFGIGGNQGAFGSEYPMGPSCGFLGRANALKLGRKLIT
jgi:hypothetical protein